MKKAYSLILLLLLLLLAACGPPAAPDTDVAPAVQDDAAPLRATPTTGAGPSDPYPAQPAPQQPPAAYPGAAPSLYDPYPGLEGQVWIRRPLGEQCVELGEGDYTNVEEAVAALADVGIAVASAEITTYPVCMGCGCPTSEHYRVQIDVGDLSQALSLGWRLEQ